MLTSIAKPAVLFLGTVLSLHYTVAAQVVSTDVSLTIPFRPSVVRTVSGKAIVYELHVHNPAKKSAPQIARVDVFDSDTSKLIVRVEGNELGRSLAKEGSLINPSYLGPSGRAVIYLWIAPDKMRLPKHLRHRVYFSGVPMTYVDSLAVDVDSKTLVLGPPVRGDNWYVGQGPANDAMHRRFIFPFDGTRPRLSQRFAIDIGRVAGKSENFVETRGDPKENRSWVVYGTPVIAVADGKVRAVRDEIAENVPQSGTFAVPINLETNTGNRVILDIGGGEYVLYGHLRPGSIKVQVGDRVIRGQVLGEIGNSGRSSGPHLHFQVMDAPSPMDAEGLPFVFERFMILGTCGETDCTPSTPSLVQQSLPVSGQLLSFPER